ncbi:MAG: nucleotidyl transferase AbiEii/AbiGii toxin family protein [Opitutaceae bacterium]|jgi:predicted nucleotidyltransferase component of viral defense system
MLTTAQLRQAAARSGARDISVVEIDVMLTHLLQLFHERGLTDHLAFKGGTFLRKMIFGSRGRLSTDLDFTCRTDISLDDLTLNLLEALNQDYRGLSFHFNRDRDWYLTEDGCAANPVLIHADNLAGVRIKIQISTREFPIRTVAAMPQLVQSYFSHLDFVPAAIPSLALEEVIAEKIRAASQRSKIRDLYDLSEIAARPLQRDLIRALAVLKLWHSQGPGFDFSRFRGRIESGQDYDLLDLRNLLRRDQSPDLDGMIARVVQNFQFLGQMTEAERSLATDLPRRLQAQAAALRAATAAL